MTDTSAFNNPIVIMENLYRNMKKSWKIAFFTTFFMGLLIHSYVLTNNFLTWDSMWNLYSPQDMLSSGRPFLTYVCAISSYFNLPWLNGILALFFLSISMVLLVEVFQLEHPVTIMLASAFVVAFPSTAEGFCYIFTIDGYMIALMLSVLAFLLTDRKKWGFIPGGLLLGFSIGIYQGYLAVTVVLCLLMMMLYILEQKDLSFVFRKMGLYFTMGVIGYGFYLISLNVMLRLKQVTLSGYQGTDRVFVFSELPKGIIEAYRNFLLFAVYGKVFGYNLFNIIATLVLVIGVVILVLFRLWKLEKHKILKILLFMVFAALLPIGSNIIQLMSSATLFRLLMRIPWVLFFVFAMVVTERYSMREQGLTQWIRSTQQWSIMACMLVLVLNFSVLSNIDYFNMNEKYEKTYSFALRLIDRIEQTEGYRTGVKVSILGGIPSVVYYPSLNVTNEVLEGHYASEGDYTVNSTEKFAAFYSHYMNVTIQTIDYSEELKLIETKEYKNMPTYPHKDSIAFIGDVLVVKLN